MIGTSVGTCVQVVQEERCRAMCPGYEDPFRKIALPDTAPPARERVQDGLDGAVSIGLPVLPA